jgi:uncharacterized protein DUF3365
MPDCRLWPSILTARPLPRDVTPLLGYRAHLPNTVRYSPITRQALRIGGNMKLECSLKQAVQTYLFVLLMALIPTMSWAALVDDASETGRLLAILLDAGRSAIAKNQDLINDASKADKGFTARLFEQKVAEEFQQRTGVALSNLETAPVPSMAKPLLARLLEEAKKTVDTYQPVINIPGFAYKGLIPATFGTETATRFQSWSGVYMKQTAPPQLVRNPKNTPDEYETSAFLRLSTSGPQQTPDSVLTEVTDEGTYVRVILPLYYRQACLACHGEPKGQRDISGYPREGAKEGQLGGAISVKVPVK